MRALVALATLLAAVSQPAPHNFTGDYLLGSWRCTVQASNGLASQRVSYTLTGGGTGMLAQGTTTPARGGTIVEDANITDNAGYFRWRDIHSGRGWRTSDWWHDGVIHWSDFNGGGRTLTFRQQNATRYTATLSSLRNPPVVSTCQRQ